ncbi:hypothetical protein [Moorena producens]
MGRWGDGEMGRGGSVGSVGRFLVLMGYRTMGSPQVRNAIA